MLNLEIRRLAYSRTYETWFYEQTREVLHGAVVVPQTSYKIEQDLSPEMKIRRHTFNGGVYDSAGLICQTALHEGKMDVRHVPDELAPPAEVSVDGKWLFGGFYFRHIGHMITESIGRLWGIEGLEGCAGVVYICSNGSKSDTDPRSIETWLEDNGKAAERNTYLQQMLSFCGINPRALFVTKPMSFDELVIPSQLAGLIPYKNLMRAHPAHHAFIQSRAARLSKANYIPRRIFVSRRKLPRLHDAFFMEDVLGDCLEAAGYLQFYPEMESLDDQIRTYGGATHIVLAAGSASHIVAMAMTGTQSVALLKRFDGQQDQFSEQLISAGAREATFIDVLDGMFLPQQTSDGQRLNLHKALLIYSVGFQRLFNYLVNEGFLEELPPRIWVESYLARARELCLRLEEHHGVPFGLGSLASSTT